MKKCLILLVILTLILVTGCGKKEKLTCTKEQKVGVVDLHQTIEYTFDGGYAIESKSIIEANFSNETSAETFSKNYPEEKGYKVTVNGSKVTAEQTQKIAKESRKDDVNKKENVQEKTEKEGYTCK